MSNGIDPRFTISSLEDECYVFLVTLLMLQLVASSLVLVSSSESSPWRKALYSSVSAAESRMFLRPRGGLPGRAAGDDGT